MIVCKITLNNQPDVDYNGIIEKILNTGDFIITASDKDFEILFASEKEEVNEAYIRRALKKYKVDFMVHTYDLNDKLDFDLYTNQWIVTNLDKQLKIKIENEQQPELQRISKKLDLLEKVIDEANNAKERYEKALATIENQNQEGEETPEEEQ